MNWEVSPELITPRVYLVGQMLAALFSDGWRPFTDEVRANAVKEAIRCADLALEMMAPPAEAEGKEAR